MRTIRSKLLVVYLLFTCIALATSFYCYSIYTKREHNAEVKDLIHLVSSEILMLNKLEMQFIVFDAKNSAFYKGSESTYIDKHKKLLIKINKHLKQLDQEGITDEKINKYLYQLKIQLIQYNNDYLNYVAKIKERGFRDDGIEGAMRKYIHDIENFYKKAMNESLLLTIRRNEKDYILRKDTVYITKHKNNVILFREKINNDNELADAEKKLYTDWLDHYYVLFTKWVLIDQEIGIDQGIGLTSKINAHNTNFENIIRTINLESDQNDLKLSSDNKSILITSIFVSVMLSIILSVLFAYRFTRPITELSDYIDVLVKNNFSAPNKLYKVHSNDEIKDLFDNVNWMVNRVNEYINEIKKHEIIIEESEKKFRSLIENSNDAIALVDVNGEVIYASSSTIKVTGYSPEELEGRFVFEEIHSDDKTKLTDHLKEIMSNPGKSFQVEFQKKHKNGEYKWIELYSCNMFEDSSVNAIIINYRDITSRKNSEIKIENQYKELQKVNAELDGFVYSASHDLKAPLSSMLGVISIAKIDSKEETSIFYFNLIEISIKKLLHVIKDIINFSRNSHLEVEKEAINFEQIIQESIQSLSYLENKGKVVFDIQIDQSGIFYSDKSRLGMMFNNMLSNAIIYHNYEQAKPVISIGVAFVNDTVEISISDNGLGIEPQYQSRIYDMFYRASKDSKGSGLGLYIVKNIVDKLNGTIELTSIPGIGTQFRMTFMNKSKALNKTNKAQLSANTYVV